MRYRQRLVETFNLAKSVLLYPVQLFRPHSTPAPFGGTLSPGEGLWAIPRQCNHRKLSNNLPYYTLKTANVQAKTPGGFARGVSLCQLQAQLLAAQDVEMQMLHGLTRMLAAVGNDPIALFQIFSLGDLGDHWPPQRCCPR